MDFVLFLLVNATLFIRPGEVVPALLGLPVYNVLIATALVVSLGPVLAQLDTNALKKWPLTVCVLGVLAMIVLSNVARFDFYSARTKGFDFLKVVAYYLLLLSVLNTPTRLRQFLGWLVLFAGVLTAAALLHHFGYVRIPALQEILERREIDEETGEETTIVQLVATGIYNDPNDFCLILMLGAVISLWKFDNRRAGLRRILWLVPCGFFIYAIRLTQSRGGLLGLLAAIMSLFASRFGWRKAMLLGVLVVPGLLLVSGGRQSQISTGEGTAQERMMLWAEGFHLVRSRPLTGIGAGMFAEEMGLVAHNSFVHSFVELGIPGGACFFGVFFVVFLALRRVGRVELGKNDPELSRMRPFLLAVLVGYGMGLYSISRCYITPTYMVAGLGAVAAELSSRSAPEAALRTSGRLMLQATAGCLGLMALTYLLLKLQLKLG